MSSHIWKSKVYRFGTVWHWKCKRPGCHGGRSRAWNDALARANAHVRDHREGRVS